MMRNTRVSGGTGRPKTITYCLAVAGFAFGLLGSIVKPADAFDPDNFNMFASDRRAGTGLAGSGYGRAAPVSQPVYSAVPANTQISGSTLQSSAPVYSSAPVSQPVYSNVTPTYRPKKKKKKKSRVARIPKEVVIYETTKRKKKARKRKRKKVRVASLNTNYVPASVPSKTRKKPVKTKKIYGGRITGAFSSCFPYRLKNIIRQVRARFGNVHVTSGYRSPGHNRRVGGARGSLHTRCMAADIKVAGVSKYTVARYVRGLPGRGGVGTYSCKGHIHVDVGRYTSWHKGCGYRRYSRRGRRR